MHPTPPPPTSAGEWAAWVIAILCAVVVAQSGVVAWLFRDAKADARLHADSLAKATDARVHELQETIKAVQPSAAAMHSLAEKVALLAQRLDQSDDQHDRHDERAAKLEERIERWERTPVSGR